MRQTLAYIAIIAVLGLAYYFGPRVDRIIRSYLPKQERVVVVEKRVEVPKIVEKIVQVPVVRVVEKPVEKIIRVPKIVEKEVTVPVVKIVKKPVVRVVRVPVVVWKRVDVCCQRSRGPFPDWGAENFNRQWPPDHFRERQRFEQYHTGGMFFDPFEHQWSAQWRN